MIYADTIMVAIPRDYVELDCREEGKVNLSVIHVTCDARMGLSYFAMICDLEDRLNRRVDMVREGQLLPFAIESANRDKILVYERNH